METNVNSIETLLNRVEDFGKTTIEIAKLKFVDKSSDVASKLISRLILLVILSFFVIILNIGIALWLGEIIGKNYFGFLAVASFYGLLLIIFAVMQPIFKRRIKNSIISQILKKEK